MLYKESGGSFWKKFKKTKVFIYTIIIMIIAVSIFTSKILFSSDSMTVIADNFFGSFFNTEDKKLAGEDDNRINFLLLGIGGKDHDGGNLTDTIILTSLQLKPLKVSMISIPRDLLIFINGYGYRKINSINALAEINEKGSGAEIVAQTIAQTFNIPIHYYLKVDFDGFKNFIDDVNGVDIYVERDFVDYLYPAPDYEYQTIRFEKGLQTMDGEKLLEYVRSRHGNNGEMGDFARAKRQQIAISAIKEKFLSVDTWLNPKHIYTLLNNYSEHFVTNLENWEILKLLSLLKNLDSTEIIKFGLSDNYDNYLQASNDQGSYVLKPKAGDFTEIQNLVKNIFDQKVTERAVIDVLNGTEIPGLAGRIKELLKANSLSTSHIGNAPKQNYDFTVIYDLSEGNKPITLENLKTLLPHANIGTELPFGIDTTAEFVVILGTDTEEDNTENN